MSTFIPRKEAEGRQVAVQTTRTVLRSQATESRP